MNTAIIVLLSMIAFQIVIYGTFKLGRRYEKKLKEQKK